MQKSSTDCGIASLKTILKQLGFNLSSESDLYKNYNINNDQGLSLYELNQILINYGVLSDSYEVSDFEQLKKVEKLPMMIVVENDGLAHYVVVHKIDKNKFTISDPSMPNIIECEEDYIKSIFLGFALCIDNIDIIPREIGKESKKKKKEYSLGEVLYKNIMKNISIKIKMKMVLLMFLKYMLPMVSTIFIQSFMQANNDHITIQNMVFPSIFTFVIILLFYFINIEEAQQKVIIENKMQATILSKYYNQKINDLDSGKNLDNVTGYFWNLLNSVSGLLQKFYFKLNIVYVLFLSILLYQFSSLLTFSLIFWFMIFSIYLKKQIPKIRNEERNIVGKSSSFSYAIENNIKTSLDINLFSKNVESEDFVKEKMNDFLKSKINRTKIESKISSTFQLIITLMTITSFIIFGLLSLKGESSDLINTSNSIFLISIILSSLSPVVQTWLVYQKSTIAIDYIQSSEDYSEDQVLKEKEKLNLKNIKKLSIDQLNFSYEENKEIIKNFSAKFESGKISAITGENGSGKSTLIKIISGILEPSSGYININNSISKSSLKDIDINDYISMYSPEFNIYGSTVGRNIRYKVFNEKLKDDEKLKYDDIFNLNLPNHYLLQSNGVNISQGQKQKVLLMRAMSQEKSIYIFDEPSGNLDSKSKIVLMENIKKLAVERNKIVILISHEEELLKYADNIINVEQEVSNEKIN
ncbi:ATP-binding cassette domain-containing protein [Sporosarcina sp. G11-34]|uniref:ATP-binding cassette domain-containing protein n=1 Tax=Sporosarcina sp. G11-34 TaxID=2849605 RepID=UPI0022A97328|nr:ATP-binding cassette domain-containing protein [Sporosarcina sp. G11-34]